MNCKKNQQVKVKPAKSAGPPLPFITPLRPVRLFLPMSLAFGGWQLAHAEDHVDYRYEDYLEDHSRMKIETHSVDFEQKLIDSIVAKGELTYDSITGATPNGIPYPDGSPRTTSVRDIRKAENIELDATLANNTITPGFAHSLESDYESYAASLNDAISFNDKNTIIQVGLSHNFDSVLDNSTPRVWQDKQSTEGIIGISQLLSPKTIFTADFTFGNDSGYLSDPYRATAFYPFGPGSPFPAPDSRPSHRNKEVVYTSLTYYIEPINGSVEGSYRFFHDSYGVFAHTVELTMHQWLGSHFILEPRFRFYEQSAADFYTTDLSGTFNPFGAPPGVYSSDYRLSELYTLDYGLEATVAICSHFHVTGGYHRYEMYGLDGVTNSGVYPKAHVLNIGFSVLW